MLKVGITGGIGSGKTTACRIFEALGIPIYYADDRAKRLMVENKELVIKIKSIFGEEAYLENGTLNRKWIGAKAFKDKALLSALNEAVHPAVFEDGKKWFDQQQGPYAIKEAALFFETGSYKSMDCMICVTAPVATRIERVMQRDGISLSAVEDRIAKQLPEAEKVAQSDYVIYNDGQQLIIPQIWSIHQRLLEASSFEVTKDR